jgi:hypothetical protein
MSRIPRKVSRLLAVSALAAGMAGGIAAAIPASASSPLTGSSVTPNDNQIYGPYVTEWNCNQAGARGVRAGSWYTYVCVPDLKEANVWWLHTSDG